MRIAIVNDMPMAVEALRRALMNTPDLDIAWIAQSGADAIAQCAKDKPDLILMDLLMPGMDGVETTRQIMQNTPCAILIVTASVASNVGKVFDAMGYGALDAVDTPVLGVQGNASATLTLLSKIATLSKLIGKFSQSAKAPPVAYTHKSASARITPPSAPTAHASSPQPLNHSSRPPLIAIGSSTGGPKALAVILSRLPADFGAAIAIVQHVDQQFSDGLVDWLNQQTPLPVRRVKVGDRLEKGTVLVAGTNDHLSLRADLTLHYVKEPADYPYRPSVDVFFKSLAQHWSHQETAVLLTGMGQDGAEGLSTLRSRGWHTIAQDKESSVVYGMPKAAAELNAAVEILSPEAIANVIIRRLKLRTSRT
ncbi:chemotaxis protein [Neosynechococcus sphagnicola sy1]|uniref:Protein-glutamate methylesterase/protein-glutamine glutaminase n=1 Tax=Neosynechococcus sphagnicola sy1 TaxID=1497020 RepID=A0A098TLZ8_9CYAN|nr:chemotaxis response regulator protein-glutamate methylesterase [Neosynechococcus sphagnicola]KGF72892.1 chemotaxis protein [Neosynechococcus sphagnicola sy1]